MFVRLLSNLNVFDCSEFFSWHFMLFYSICPIWIIVIRQRGFASQQVSKNVIFSLCQCYIKGREVDYRTWNGWMASPTQWTWVRVNSGSRWWTGRSGVLQSLGSVATSRTWLSDWTELSWTEHQGNPYPSTVYCCSEDEKTIQSINENMDDYKQWTYREVSN